MAVSALQSKLFSRNKCIMITYDQKTKVLTLKIQIGYKTNIFKDLFSINFDLLREWTATYPYERRIANSLTDKDTGQSYYFTFLKSMYSTSTTLKYSAWGRGIVLHCSTSKLGKQLQSDLKFIINSSISKH